MDDDGQLFVWIVNWPKFQHYKPDPARGPAWIKQYPAQLWDDTYLSLTDHQRCVLHDLRMCFANMRGKVPLNTRKLSGLLRVRVTKPTLEALNHAGLIEFCSRTTLESRLELFYSRSRLEVEVEKEQELSVLPTEPNYADADINLNGGGSGQTFHIPDDLLRGIP